MQDDFDLQAWCGAGLAAHTPTTVNVPLSRSAAQAIVKAYDDVRFNLLPDAVAARERSKQSQSSKIEGPNLADTTEDFFADERRWRVWLGLLDSDDSNTLMGFESRLDDVERATLRALAASIDAAVRSVSSGRADGSTAAFVRLSTRSPKDVALRTEYLQTQILFMRERQTLIGEHFGDASGDESEIDPGILLSFEVIAIIRATSRILRSSSGAEALKFLCSSERAYQDLTMRLLTAENDDSVVDVSDDAQDAASDSDFKDVIPNSASVGDMHVAVREWCDELLPEYEFRAFVRNRELNGCSQYYKACFVPELARRADELSLMIYNFFYNTIRDNITLDDYVIDFAVTADNNVMLVELNHFKTSTSSALFDWTTDFELLHHGPYEFRCLTRPLPDVKMTIAAPLRELARWTTDASAASEESDDFYQAFKSKIKGMFASRAPRNAGNRPSIPKFRGVRARPVMRYWKEGDASLRTVASALAGPFGRYLIAADQSAFWKLSEPFLGVLRLSKQTFSVEATGDNADASGNNLATAIAVVVLEIFLAMDDRENEQNKAHRQNRGRMRLRESVEQVLARAYRFLDRLEQDETTAVHNARVLMVEQLDLLT